MHPVGLPRLDLFELRREGALGLDLQVLDLEVGLAGRGEMLRSRSGYPTCQLDPAFGQQIKVLGVDR
jgi:hypothetical protein